MLIDVRYRIRGLTKEKIIDMLGESDADKGFTFPGRGLTYFMNHGFMDSYWFVIYFDENGKVVQTMYISD